MDWSLNINKAGNGYICEWWFDDDEGCQDKKQWVIEEQDTEYGELEAMRDLLYLVMQHFGINYSKHNKRNICIEIKETEDE